jgi:hypothetical protein
VLIQGHKIQATVPWQLVPVFDEIITEGVVYDMKFFSIRMNMSDTMATFHKFKLVFNVLTLVDSVESYIISNHGLSLINSKNVLSLTKGLDYLVGKQTCFVL